MARPVRYVASQFSALLPRRRAVDACPFGRARADDEIVLTQKANQPQRVSGAVLAVAVHDQHVGAGGGADPGFHRRAVAFVVRVRDHPRAGSARPRPPCRPWIHRRRR